MIKPEDMEEFVRAGEIGDRYLFGEVGDSPHRHLFMQIKLTRSKNRQRTISARLVDDVMMVYAPLRIPDAELEKAIDNLKKRLHKMKMRHELNKTQNLMEVAKRFNREYFSERLKIESIEYSTSQEKKFGCCNYRTRRVLISHRLTQMPQWVRDYVIFHELAHLVEPNHGNAFWEIVNQYRLAERARGYLMAKGLDSEDEGGDLE